MKFKFKNLIPDFLKSKKSYMAIFPNSNDDVAFDGKTQYDYLNYNEISLYVNKAIDKRAEKVGEIQFVLKQKDKIVENHPLIKLLNRPNQYHTGKQFWKTYQKHLDLTGNAFIFIETGTEIFDTKNIKALHLLRPDWVEVKFSADYMSIDKYIYRVPGGKTTEYTAEQVLYSFEPDPKDLLKGASLLRSGIRAIETEVQLAEYQAKILKNGGKVDGVFKFKTAKMTAEQMSEVKASYKKQREDLADYDNNLFLSGDTEYQQLGLRPDELSYLESKKVTLDDICILTGVPKSILGITSGETFANADASIAIFLRETIKPLIESLSVFLDWRLIPADMDLEYIDPTPENVDRKIKLLEAGHSTNSLTINEQRKMLGYEPYKNPEADQILIPFSSVTLGSENQDPTQNGIKSKTVKDFEHPLRDSFMRKKYGEVMVKRMNRRESKLLSEMKKYFDSQRERIVSYLTQAKVFRKKGIIDGAFDQVLEINLAKKSILPVLEEIVKESGKDAYNLLGSSKYEFQLSSSIGNWLEKRASLFAEEINKTTFERLKNQFEQSLDESETREQLIGRIENTYEGFNEGRAQVIARTEVHGATTKGTFEGYKQAGAPIKIWVSVGDGSTRESHLQIDGEEKPIDIPFSNGLQFPGDPGGSADETINCRCVI